MNIQAVIFDMDGVLIDSEPFWQEAEQEAFAKVGIALTQEQMRQTTGLREDEVIEYWYARYPWEGHAKKEIGKAIVEGVIARVRERGKKLPGVDQALADLREAGLPLALASSSELDIINTVLDTLDLRGYFDAIHSAEHEPYGKPHPGVYILAAKKLNIAPEYCLAIEDSFNGLLSAKAAKMKCIAVPEAYLMDDKRFAIADKVLSSLEEFQVGQLEELT